LQGRLGGKPLGDQPDTGGEEAGNNQDRAHEDGDLLLAKAHFANRITDRSSPAKFGISVIDLCLAHPRFCCIYT
jgi:hypothetical protein